MRRPTAKDGGADPQHGEGAPYVRTPKPIRGGTAKTKKRRTAFLEFGYARENEKVPLTYTGDAPVLVFGPPGSSKTVGFVMNQLLDDVSPRSYIVIDPKGEIAACTARFRRKLRGHSVKIINPYGLLADIRPDLQSDGWNPLADLDPTSPAFGDDCAARGDALIKTNANEMQPIFPNSARSALTAAINYEIRTARLLNETPSLPACRALLTLDTEQLVEQVDRMIATDAGSVSCALAGTEGDADQQSTCRAQNRESVSQALGRLQQVDGQ